MSTLNILALSPADDEDHLVAEQKILACLGKNSLYRSAFMVIFDGAINQRPTYRIFIGSLGFAAISTKFGEMEHSVGQFVGALSRIFPKMDFTFVDGVKQVNSDESPLRHHGHVLVLGNNYDDIEDLTREIKGLFS